jgi:hypothetical protein
VEHTGTRTRGVSLGNARYSHFVWLRIHGTSCRCLMCRLHRAERERVTGAVDALDVLLSLWIGQARYEGS